MSIHNHIHKKHANGRLYNDKCGGISRTKKSYHVRDIPWTSKWIITVHSTSAAGKYEPKNIGQHAANSVEFYHSLPIRNFNSFQYTPVHLPFIPSAQLRIIFSNHIRNTAKLLKKYNENEANFKDHHISLIRQIQKIHDDYLGLNKLEYKKDRFGHGILYFPGIDRTLQEWYKGFRQEECTKRISPLFAEDFTLLFWLIYNSEQTKYGKFDDVSCLISDKRIIDYLYDALGHRMTEIEIKSFIIKEWNRTPEQEMEELIDQMYTNGSAAEADDHSKTHELGKKDPQNRYVVACVYFISFCFVLFCFVLFCFVHTQILMHIKNIQ